MGDDIQVKRLKSYEAYKRIRNIACVAVQPVAKTIAITVRLNPDTVALEEGFTRYVRKVGRWGTGDLEIILRTMEYLKKAKPLRNRAYEES